MNLTSKCHPALAVWTVLLLTGCTSLQVEVLPPEPALPASTAPFWTEISKPQSGGEWFYLLNTGDEALEWRLRMIDSARVSIDMEAFLWMPDDSGSQILEHILVAADRGVRVRLLLDDSFTMHEDLALHIIDDHPNISFRLYNPFRHRSNSALSRQLFNAGEFSRINHRMHNKELIIDGRAILVGGRNLADEYFGLHDKITFRDMDVISVGASVSTVVENFDLFWNSGWAFPLADILKKYAVTPEDMAELRSKLAANTPELFVPDLATLEMEWQVIAQVAYPGSATFFYDDPATHDPAAAEEAPNQLAIELKKLIDGAASEVILITAYLVPTPELEEVIERIEARGVQVRILTNSLSSNNHVAADAAYRKHLTTLVGHGANLHEVRVMAKDRDLYIRQPVDEKQLGLHAKLILIDDHISYIGSSNLDPRSLKINTEVGLVIESVELNRALRELLAVDFEPRNSWAVQQTEDGDLIWIDDDESLLHEPASHIRRLEDWFFGKLPIEGEM